MDYSFDFAVVFSRFDALLYGCLLTLQLSAGAIVLSLVIAIAAVALMQARISPAIKVINGFVEVVRNTPFLVQIFFIYFGLPSMGVRFDPNIAALIALGINGAAYSIEIIRAGVEAIPKGQLEAGVALGLKRSQIFRYIIIKPALRTIYPALTSQFIFLMLTSSIASSITANELTHVGAAIEGETFRSFEVYFIVAVLYLAMSFLMSLMFRAIAQINFSYPVK
ncbi:ABC transporter permease subunit [Agrobacterium vitis]|uniref:amino acid ABC transporter permease n=1 Tax=Agrobacterium vitis TaxID=373 RepID=UPI0012E8234F|nr:amino acid ABC transporter permease [Agrobacterium vitis]MVA22049.1 ABC transporter permease subunit [Agrobacterium vitis]